MASGKCLNHGLKVVNLLVLVAVVLIVLYDKREKINAAGIDVLDKTADTIHRITKRSIVQGSPGGAMYTRWGRNKCGNDSVELIYAGVIAGSHFTHTGGGSDYLCMPLDVQWGRVVPGGQQDSLGRAHLHGAEYMGNSENIFSMRNIDASSMNNQDAVCAVCRTLTRSSLLMIPGRVQCPSGWTTEYRGYLMAEKYTHKGRTTHVCVDEAPEARIGGFPVDHGVLLYPVEAWCGSLPCPVYVTGNEIACVVCTI